ncbi:response regulator [Cohnella sp. GCM10027633]|uniref:response regulator transcription factor n=1 Tax=unclassified Cohnella TaxID=2636738 RepID=UPI00363E02BD
MYRVMIVDDEPVIRFGIKALIDWNKEGFEVIGEYANGVVALDTMLSQPADVLITDIKMPMMDGLALSREAMKLNPACKVVLVSSHNDFEFVREGLKMGAVDYMLKHSLEPEDLLSALRKCKELLQASASAPGGHALAQPTTEARQPAGGGADEGASDQDPIGRALAYIGSRDLKTITLQQVADAVHVSKNYFSVLFKKTTGHNFIDYVIGLRLEKAKGLLADSNLKIYVIAEQAGFNDVKYFSKLFKKNCGLSPIDYRLRHGSGSFDDAEGGEAHS